MPESFGRPSPPWARPTTPHAIQADLEAARAERHLGLATGIPHIAQHVDDLTVLRSCWADGLNHVGSVCQMNTGSILAGRPSLGAWATYGLGSANENLPTFVILTDDREVDRRPEELERGFPARRVSGHAFRREGPPIFHLAPPETRRRRPAAQQARLCWQS